MTTIEAWMLGATLVMAMCAVGALIVAIIALNRRMQTQISNSPLSIKIDQELYERFASKKEFEKHVALNTERHTQLFKGIEKAEETARRDLGELSKELNVQLTYIRESLTAINTELKINRPKIADL